MTLYARIYRIKQMTEFASPPVWKKHSYQLGSCDLEGVKYRIGSDSTQAMVFKVVLGGIPLACKVMLVTKRNPFSANLTEVRVTEMLGKKYPAHFVKVYGAYDCDNVILPRIIQNKSLVDEAIIYNIQTRILPDLLSKHEITKMEVLYRSTDDKSIYSEFWSANLPALLMFSELGHTDLKNWEMKWRTLGEWNSVIDQVLEALEALKRENITHGDLHHGNVLLMSDGQVKLIDFGEFSNEYEPHRDLDIFLQGFSYIDNLPESVKQRIQELDRRAHVNN